jgi:hypothetical protein
MTEKSLPSPLLEIIVLAAADHWRAMDGDHDHTAEGANKQAYQEPQRSQRKRKDNEFLLQSHA